MPKQAPDLPLPGVHLDPDRALPLHRQIYEQLSSAIRSGQLKPGTRLPSTRALAIALGVSRTTSMEAYRDLLAEGYLEAKVGAGTRVAQIVPEPFHAANVDSIAAGEADSFAEMAMTGRPTGLSQRGSRYASLSSPEWFSLAGVGGPRPFRLGSPALDVFPQKAWARAITRALRSISGPGQDYQESAGYLPLREELASYLAVSRGVRCSADQIIIVAGIQSGLSLIAHLLLDEGDAIWMEDPGYLLARMAFEAAGASVIPIPIDREGLVVSNGKAHSPDARLAYVTPSHQFPMGVTMSYARRLELLQWARQAGAWIVEDDYDSEYQYTSRPIPALQGLDETGQVIYLGTFSKVLFPALRLGYVVLPPNLVNAFATAQRTMSFHPPKLEQAALALFLAEGEFLRHIRRMRGLYEGRRDLLLRYARQHLPEYIQFDPRQSGLHVVGRLPEYADEFDLVRLAKLHGVTVYPLSGFSMGPNTRRGIILGFAAFREDEIKSGIQKLAVAWPYE